MVPATSAQPPHVTSLYYLFSEWPCQEMSCASLAMSQLEVHHGASPETVGGIPESVISKEAA